MSKPVVGEDGPTPVVNTDTTVRVRVYDSEADTTKDAFFFKVPKTSIDNGDLANLHKIMTNVRAQREYALLHFCNKDGAIVDDTWTVKEYLESIVEVKPTSGQILDVFLKKATKRTYGSIKPPDWDPGYPLNKGDNDSKFDNFNWKADAFDGDRKYPADLREKEWVIVAHNNSLFYGLTIIRGSSEDGKVPIRGIDRAKLPAFRFKARNIPAYELSNDPGADVDLTLHIPDFIVDDRSDVSVFETNNEFQSSMAKSSFSQLDIEAAVSGGAFGMEFEASAGYGNSSSGGSSETTMKSSQNLHIQYSFPRVTLNLDEYNLEMTPQCIDALANLKDNETLTAFLETYGEFFTTRAQLGGRLYSSDEMTKTIQSDTEEAKQSMKAGASASFKASFTEGSASAKTGSGSADDKTQTANSLARSLCWEANGGDSLLCNNPSAWCPTVASFYNWRTTKQDGVYHMIDMLAKFPGNQNLKSRIKDWDPDKNYNPPVQFRLRLADNVRRPLDLNLSLLPARVMSVASAWSSGSYGQEGLKNNLTLTEASEVGDVGFWNFKYRGYDRLGLKTDDGKDVYEAKAIPRARFLHNLVGSTFPKPHNALTTPSGGFVKFMDADGADRRDQPIATDAQVTVHFYPTAKGQSDWFLAAGDGYLVRDNVFSLDDDPKSPILTLEKDVKQSNRKVIVLQYQLLQ
ncbi:hypothetical protein PG997_007503 [Apiospora hydei]|uniref:MACPF-like domain-containing protein n=1 Tax=Apiospora hydei TaxID=1337664 RepID=A0ABR1WB42_9PEZI